MKTLVQHATIVSDNHRFTGNVAIENGKIAFISQEPLSAEAFDEVIDAQGLLMLPGVIDTHVHFRDPGFTHKGDMATESRAAAAGGVTTVMDMPNTLPATTSEEALLEKAHLAAEKSVIRMGFYLGATRENAPRLSTIDPSLYCGVKVFLGASTGGMLLDEDEVLDNVFKTAPKPIVAHCEDQEILTILYTRARGEYPLGDAPIALHSQLRPAEACISATQRAIALAEKHRPRQHSRRIGNHCSRF